MSAVSPDATAIGVRTYNIDPMHSSVGFSVRHLMIATVRGSLSGLSGTLTYDPENKANSAVNVVIDTTTINTGVADRDNHLKSADFLDVAKFPTITFKSTSVDPASGEITGDLTIKGVTKPVTLNVVEESPEIKDGWGNQRIAFEAHTKINRSDHGITFNIPLDGGGITIGEELKINIEAQFVRQA